MAYDDQTKKYTKYIQEKDINKKKEKALSKKNLNNSVKDLTEKYHSKTYFNSIEQAIINNIQRHKNINNVHKNDSKCKLKKNFSVLSINFYSKIKYKNHKNMQNQKSNLSSKNSDYKKLEKFIDDKSNNNRNTLHVSYDNIYRKEKVVEKVFQLNNPGFVQTKSNKLDSKQKEALLILKDMSFQKEKIHSNPFTDNFFQGSYLEQNITKNVKNINELNEKSKKEILDDDKYVIFNNIIYNKNDKEDMRNIRKAVLQHCHFINIKYDNDEKNQLKKGNGKLMITNGLSIKEFSHKHALPDINS